MKWQGCSEGDSHFFCAGHMKKTLEAKKELKCCRCSGFTWDECSEASSVIPKLAAKINKEYEEEKAMNKWMAQDHDESLEEKG